jgi:phosphate starvation-inducible PhoH-like protein
LKYNWYQPIKYKHLNERIIELEEINPNDFFGAHNSTVEELKKYFPKIKIVARGSKMKIYGEPELLDEFEIRLERLIKYYNRYNKLDDNSIERILTSTGNEEKVAASKNIKDVLVHGVGGKLIKPQTENQRKMVALMAKNDMLFAVGPAGTGKTYTAVALAVKALKEKEVRKIILTRPAVESGENLGFLPGDLKEKLDPYMQPLYDALRDMITHERLESYLEKGVIQIAPLAFMRGRTLDNAFVILDEAQNTTHNQMKMFLTRMGKSAKFIITGDPGQIDLPRKQVSGLKESLLVLKDINGIAQVYLDDKDVVRHKLVKSILSAYKTIEKD